MPLKKMKKTFEFFNFRVDTSLIAMLENIATNGFERLSYTDAIKVS